MQDQVVDLKKLEQELEERRGRLVEEKFAKLRTGRINPRSFANVMIELPDYGRVSLQTVALIAVDKLTLQITPYDQKLLAELVKALNAADLGYNAIDNGSGRAVINIPPMTEEVRTQEVAKMKQMVEDTRVAARQLREEYMHKIKNQEQGTSEDLIKKAKEEVQKRIDNFNTMLTGLAEDKEREIKQV